MKELKTTIGLEIHVQLKTKSKMFCRCDNNAEGKAPNTVVCPVCLGLPGALPVANRQAIEWTIKAGLAIGSQIPAISKFDRKHYFYPDLPKGYQISQYDEPFCVGGKLLVDGQEVIFNRIHLEEDAGKLLHSGGKSLVDLNRAGTPLMEMVTEPTITSPKQAGDFLRRLQKLVRDEGQVSDADMEKGHLRCDANISVTDGERMSEIVEIKNLNSFRFVEKALALEDERLRSEYSNWPERKAKVTRGYNSKDNTTYVQREKEEAADYRYFPEPDLPPFDTSVFNLEALKRDISLSHEDIIVGLVAAGVSEPNAKVLANDRFKRKFYGAITGLIDAAQNIPDLNGYIASVIVNNRLGFSPDENDLSKAAEYLESTRALLTQQLTHNTFVEVNGLIHEKDQTFAAAVKTVSGDSTLNESELEKTVDVVLAENPTEVASYKAGKKQLFGFFVGQIMRQSGGKANPQKINELLRTKLGEQS